MALIDFLLSAADEYLTPDSYCDVCPYTGILIPRRKCLPPGVGPKQHVASVSGRERRAPVLIAVLDH